MSPKSQLSIDCQKISDALLRAPYSSYSVLCTPYLQRGKKKEKRMENKFHHPTPTLGLFELTQLSPSLLILFYIVVRIRFQIAARLVHITTTTMVSTTTGQEICLSYSTASCMRWTDTTEY